MENNEAKKPDQPYCSLRADNEERWSFIQQYIEDCHQTLLDIGCAEGYFTNAAAEHGLEAIGIEVNEGRYKYAKAKFGDHENICFQLRHVTPENVSELPSSDLTLVLTVQHHWVGAYGVEEATQMLKSIAQKAEVLFYEPPGTMYLSKENPIHPDESITKYREYLEEIFNRSAKITDVGLFPHVNEGEYLDRCDPLFVVKTMDV